jgi:branched-chain amino acid aminotransferase
MIQSDFAWMNGKLIPFAQATTHISTFTLHYGVAAFEGIRCYKRADGRSAVFRLREHIERLFGSMKVCGNEVPYSIEQVEAGCWKSCAPTSLTKPTCGRWCTPAPGRWAWARKTRPSKPW